MGYTKTAVWGVSWLVVLRGVTRGLSFLRVFYLARILSPAQFGTFGIATLVLSLIEVMTETGVNIVLIQEDRSLFKRYLNSAWVVSIIRGSIIGLLIALTSPIVANFFRNPDAIPMLLVIALVPIVRGWINPSLVLWQKDLEFHKDVWLKSSVAVVGTIVSIALAILWRSPIALAIGMLVEATLEAVLSHLIIKPTPRFRFAKKDFWFIVSRGKWMTAAGTFHYLFQQVDDMVVGRRLGQTSLGYYQMAYRLATLPITEVSDVFMKVTFPIYGKVVGDQGRLRRAFTKTSLAVIGLSIPFGLLLILFPSQIVQIVLGDQWLAIIPLLPILGIFGVLRAITNSCFSLFLAVKKQEYVTVVTVVGLLAMIVILLPLVSVYGMLGVAYAALIGSLVVLPVAGFYTWRIIR